MGGWVKTSLYGEFRVFYPEYTENFVDCSLKVHILNDVVVHGWCLSHLPCCDTEPPLDVIRCGVASAGKSLGQFVK